MDRFPVREVDLLPFGKISDLLPMRSFLITADLLGFEFRRFAKGRSVKAAESPGAP